MTGAGRIKAARVEAGRTIAGERMLGKKCYPSQGVIISIGSRFKAAKINCSNADFTAKPASRKEIYIKLGVKKARWS